MSIFRILASLRRIGQTRSDACRKPIFGRVVIAVLVAAGLSTPAYADFSCNVTVQGVLPYTNGAVNVLHSGRGDWTFVCNLESTYTVGNSVGPTTCAMWAALLLRAKKDNRMVQFWFPGAGSCSTIATYSAAPVPTYIGEIF